ncbi:MAG: hypothetical protein EXR72_21140 [Myxococcales bacterium]|nr:hypothetical protein [Myxococcales bacterium]
MKNWWRSAAILAVAAGAVDCAGGGGGNNWWMTDDGGATDEDGGLLDDGGAPVNKDLGGGGKADQSIPGAKDLAMQPGEEDLAVPPQPADMAVPPQKSDMSISPKGDMAGKPLGAVGDPCVADASCQGGLNAQCITNGQGWPNGYCAIKNCQPGSCPNGSDCYKFQGGAMLCLKLCMAKNECRAEYACPGDVEACVPGCAGNADCDPGEVCSADLVCVKAPCSQQNPCAQGLKCTNGQCVPDLGGGPGAGPGPNCNLPARDCVGDNAYCGALIQFIPPVGVGYDDYAINGETLNNQYRSWARRDLVMLVKYAAAYVDCKAKNWVGGNGMPVAPGDMSEMNGAIPGTSIGQPGHPKGTHTNGYDMDIGYYQIKPPNNYLRPICPYTLNGVDQYHCVGPPDNVDLWRTTLFIGALFSSGRVRVLGIDGKVGPLVQQAMPTLCANGWLTQTSCNKIGKLAFEVTDMGLGWFQFHHHHIHISLNNNLGMSKGNGAPACPWPVCQEVAPKTPLWPGEAVIVNPEPKALRFQPFP